MYLTCPVCMAAGGAAQTTKVWKKVLDEDYQHYFWYNIVTKESLWFKEEDETKEDWEMASSSHGSSNDSLSSEED